MIPTQRGAKRVNEERVFIAAEVGFSGALTFAVILWRNIMLKDRIHGSNKIVYPQGQTTFWQLTCNLKIATLMVTAHTLLFSISSWDRVKTRVTKQVKWLKSYRSLTLTQKEKQGTIIKKCFPKCKTFTHTYIHTFNPSNIHTVYKLFCTNNPLKEATRGMFRPQISCIRSLRHTQQW